MTTTHIATCKLDSKINSAVESIYSKLNFQLIAARRDDRTELIKTCTYHYASYEKLDFRSTGSMVLSRSYW